MANYATLKAAVQSVITTNGNNEITGAILQDMLLSIITSLGADYQFIGIATPETSPGTPDQNVFYIGGAGIYPNFNAVSVPAGNIAVFKYNGSWVTEMAQVGKDYDSMLQSAFDAILNAFDFNVSEISPTGTQTGYLLNAVTGLPRQVSNLPEYKLANFAVNPGDVFLIKTGMNYAYGLYSVMDAYGNIILKAFAASGAAYTDVEAKIVIPAGGTTLYVGYNSNHGTAQVYTNFESKSNDLILSDFKEITLDAANYVRGYCLNSSGNVINAGSDAYSYAIFDVRGTKKLNIVAAAVYTNPYYGFFSSLDTISAATKVSLSETHSGSTITQKTFNDIIVPNGAICLVVNIQKNYSYGATKIVREVINPNHDAALILPELVLGNLRNVVMEEVSRTPSSIVSSNGNIVAAGTDSVGCVVYDLAKALNRKLNIVCGVNYNNPYYAFYSSLENPGSTTLIERSEMHSGSTPTQQTFNNITIPDGAACLVINYSKNYSYQVSNPAKEILNPTRGPLFNKKWACIGDSLTEENQRTTKHYFDYIKDETGIMPLNYGVSGSGYARLREENKAFYQRISSINTDSDIVTIFGSFNDLGAINNDFPLGNINDNGIISIAGCINATLDNLFAIKPIVRLGIIAPTPWNTTQPGTMTSADNYVALLKNICDHRSIPFLDLYHHSNLRPWDATFRSLAYTKDNGGGTHPDETGHSLIAPMIRQFILSLI